MKTTVAAVGLVLVVIAAAKAGNAGHTPTRPAGAVTAARVVGTEFERDPDHPATGTHYADCRAADGSQFRVVVSADTEYRLSEGQPCPAGPHVPTARQENPALYDEISSARNAPMPFHGGDVHGPCGEWEAADQADADQMRTAYQQCMNRQGGGQR